MLWATALILLVLWAAGAVTSRPASQFALISPPRAARFGRGRNLGSTIEFQQAQSSEQRSRLRRAGL